MANVKISDLTAAAAATSTQQFEVNDSGASKSVTGAQLKSFVLGDITASAAELNQLDTNTFTADITIPDKIIHASDTNTSIRFPAADTVTVETSGAERMRIDASGNLGLGVTPSAWHSTAKAIEFAYPTYGMSAGGGAFMSFNASQNSAGNWIYKSTDQASRFDCDTGGAFSWHTAGTSAGTAGNAITFTQAMTLDASGNLGIGTSSPAKKLHVSSGADDEVARFEGTGSPYISLYDSGVRQAYLFAGAAQVSLAAEASKPLALEAGGAERVRIGTAGQIGIGGANYGTSGQVLTSGGSGAAPSWASAASVTLLGTITTPSGNSRSLSGLNLTPYTFIIAAFDAVSVVNTGLISMSGITVGTTATTGNISGLVTIDITTGCGTVLVNVTSSTNTPGRGFSTATTTQASTSITVSVDNTFDAGSVHIYGVK
jgi:hypothetical protein